MADRWAAIYLQDAVFPARGDFGGAKPNSTLLMAMQQMCSYDTVAFGIAIFAGCLPSRSGWITSMRGMSSFMNGNGASSPLGHGYGVGWVNEFVSRLTKTPWDPATQTSENSTLNMDPTTFPLDRRFYVDFTHDSTITSRAAALDLPNFDERFEVPDGGKGLDAKRNFITSKAVPFAARFVVEVWQCGKRRSGSGSS